MSPKLLHTYLSSFWAWGGSGFEAGLRPERRATGRWGCGWLQHFLPCYRSRISTYLLEGCMWMDGSRVRGVRESERTRGVRFPACQRWSSDGEPISYLPYDMIMITVTILGWLASVCQHTDYLRDRKSLLYTGTQRGVAYQSTLSIVLSTLSRHPYCLSCKLATGQRVRWGNEQLTRFPSLVLLSFNHMWIIVGKQVRPRAPRRPQLISISPVFRYPSDPRTPSFLGFRQLQSSPRRGELPQPQNKTSLGDPRHSRNNLIIIRPNQHRPERVPNWKFFLCASGPEVTSIGPLKCLANPGASYTSTPVLFTIQGR